MKMQDQSIENMMVLPRPAMKRQTQRVSPEDAQRAAYAAAEKRLSELSLVRARLEDEKEELAELENLGVEALRHCSASLVSILRPGMRVEPEEVHAMQMARLRSRINADEREVTKMTNAMECLKTDPLFQLLELRYTRGMNDTDIADKLLCDRSTVLRHRKALITKLAARLYGSI